MTKELKSTKLVMHDAAAHWPVPSSSPQPASPQFITECLGVDGTSGNPLIQSPAKAGSPGAGCTGWCPGECWVFPEKQTPKPLWASLFQCSVTVTGKKFSLVFRGNFLCSGLCSLPLVLSLGTTGKSLVSSSGQLPLGCLSVLVRFPLSHFFPG